jgi:hypothetical protein
VSPPTHFAIHLPSYNLSLWRTTCGLSLPNAASWVTTADHRVTCRKCSRILAGSGRSTQ